MRKATEGNQWRLWWAPAGFVAGHVAAIALLLLIGLALRSLGASHVRIIGLAEAVLVLSLAATAALFVRRTGRWPGPADFGFRPTASRAAVGWTTVGYISFVLTVAIYRSAVHGVRGNAPLPHAVTGALPSIATVTALVVLAPVGEELFYRGFLYRALRARLSVLWATVIVGATFGLMHVPFAGVHLKSVPLLAAVGCIACLLYERTGSLYPSIALHATINGAAASIAIYGTASPAFTWTLACAALFLAAPWRVSDSLRQRRAEPPAHART